MSGMVLSAAVRQNLLSLQSTAALLSTTQNRLASGKKVNSALDNPTNYFTAQGLDNRASDINNLLDAIGNGVQVLQAANTGLTSLQKLVDTAKTIANPVLQTTTGYTQKASATSAAPTRSPGTKTVGAGNDNSIPGSKAALTSAGLGLTASLASNGSITLTSTNDNASQTLTTGTTAAANNIAISGTATPALVTPTGG